MFSTRKASYGTSDNPISAEEMKNQLREEVEKAVKVNTLPLMNGMKKLNNGCLGDDIVVGQK